MQEIFYAHSRAGMSSAHSERLEPHLKRVATLARRFACGFGAPQLGAAAGLLHDLGKYTEAFQRLFRGKIGRAEHSIHGAKAAIDLYGPIGHLIAYAIAGHHAGLPDGEGSEDDALARRLRAAAAEPVPIWRERITLPDTSSLAAEADSISSSDIEHIDTMRACALGSAHQAEGYVGSFPASEVGC